MTQSATPSVNWPITTPAARAWQSSTLLPCVRTTLASCWLAALHMISCCRVTTERTTWISSKAGWVLGDTVMRQKYSVTSENVCMSCVGCLFMLQVTRCRSVTILWLCSTQLPLTSSTPLRSTGSCWMPCCPLTKRPSSSSLTLMPVSFTHWSLYFLLVFAGSVFLCVWVFCESKVGITMIIAFLD